LKTILIVEDERILAVSLKLDLQDSGYEVVGIASNGDDAIELIKSKTPSLVLMDISINGDKNGIDTAHEINLFSNIPVIFLTGETDEATVTRARLCPNCRGYLQKPVDINVLIDLIAEHIEVN
jgi:DNA-binding NarL/FixJ family response regulator